jgi:hypothetical protein
LLLLALPVRAGDRLAMRVSPAYAYAPANLTIHVFIEPDLENRAIYVTADSQVFYRSSVVELDGRHAPRTTVFRYRGVPAGDYEVRSVLIGAGGQERAMVHQVVTVLTSGGR